MLLIDTFLKKTEYNGIGLHSAENILKGTIYWVRNESFDRVYTEIEIKSFPEIVGRFIKMYGFQEINDNWYLCNDNDRFTNHSSQPNAEAIFGSSGLLEYFKVIRNIDVGEEILIDYSKICKSCSDELKFPTDKVMIK